MNAIVKPLLRANLPTAFAPDLTASPAFFAKLMPPLTNLAAFLVNAD